MAAVAIANGITSLWPHVAYIIAITEQEKERDSCNWQNKYRKQQYSLVFVVKRVQMLCETNRNLI